ncbi:MAG: sensor histidine kinase, partial [Caldilineales bacterium]|nr:sensor histidine kinase [Caldilineales bacterium]
GAGGGAGGGWGLLGMQERAGLLGGSILIDAAPGQGTAITVHIPLLTERNHESADSIVVGG